MIYNLLNDEMGHQDPSCPAFPFSCHYKPCPGSCSACGTHLEEDEWREVYCPVCQGTDEYDYDHEKKEGAES